MTWTRTTLITTPFSNSLTASPPSMTRTASPTMTANHRASPSHPRSLQKVLSITTRLIKRFI
eukprot:252663-Pleurochrysis_carterae.AAC.1